MFHVRGFYENPLGSLNHPFMAETLSNHLIRLLDERLSQSGIIKQAHNRVMKPIRIIGLNKQTIHTILNQLRCSTHTSCDHRNPQRPVSYTHLTLPTN